jgi:hypothetical protein
MTVEHWIPNHFTVCLPYTDEVGDGVESNEENDLHDAELVTDGAELATDGTEPVTPLYYTNILPQLSCCGK